MTEWNAQQLTEKFVAYAHELSRPQAQMVADHTRSNLDYAILRFKDMCIQSDQYMTKDTFNFIWNTKYESSEYMKNFIDIAFKDGIHRAIQSSTAIINALINLLRKGFKSVVCDHWINGHCHNKNICVWRHETQFGHRRSYFIDGLNLIEGSKNFNSKKGFERLYLTIIYIIMYGHSSDIKIYFPERIVEEIEQSTISIDPTDFYFNITISLLKSRREFLVGTRGKDGDDIGVLSGIPLDTYNCFIVSKDQYHDKKVEFARLKNVVVITPNFSLDKTTISCGTRTLGKIWNSKSPQGTPYRSPGHRSRRSPSPESRTHRHRDLEFRSRRSPSPRYMSRRSRSPESRTHRHRDLEFRSRRSRSPEYRTSPPRECTPEDLSVHGLYTATFMKNNKLRIKTE